MKNRMLYSFEDFCGIEERYNYSGINGTRGAIQYRFYSKYNGMRGAWCYDINKAKDEGEQHINIVLQLIKNNK